MTTAIKNFFAHLKTVFRHKFWVFIYCCKAGMPLRGLAHDMSKFSPTEFFEGVKYYQGTRSPIDKCKEERGYSLAWLHHKGRNPHHYEYWIDEGKAITMPFKYACELVCDYMGAGRAYMGKDFSFAKELSWWEGIEHKKDMALETKTFVWSVMVSAGQEEKFPKKKWLKYLYDQSLDKDSLFNQYVRYTQQGLEKLKINLDKGSLAIVSEQLDKNPIYLKLWKGPSYNE